MHRQLLHLCICVSLFSLAASQTYADDTIEFPDEELATESVLPVFDKTVAVRERLVKTAGRFEVGGGGGLNLIEALYNNVIFNLNATYNMNEESAFTAYAIFANTGLSNMGNDLKDGKGLSGNNTFDASLAPAPEMYLSGNYQFTAYYGKVSVTKSRAMNLSLYGLGGLGVVQWEDGTEPLLNVGMGQKLYFTPKAALRFDLQLMTYRGPDPTSISLQTGSGERKAGAFKDTTYFRSFLTVGLSFLF